jgi:hypothetical protein
MRDIIDTLSFLSESTGLAGRKAGDVFRNPQGEELVFNDIQFFPAQGGKFTPEQVDKFLKSVEKQQIQWMNARSPRTGGIAIASFRGDNGDIYMGRYLESIKPSKTDNYVPNQVGEFRFAGKAAAKAQAGLSPQDLLVDRVNQTIPSIMNQLAKSLGTNHPLYAVAHKVAMGQELPIEFPAPADMSFTAFRDYFCEILQPIALQKGNYSGNAGEAAEIFMGGSFDGSTISFDASKTAGLSDSILEASDGRIVKVSSKGNKGATASAKNLVDSVNELQQTPAGKKLVNKHKEIIDLMREIQTQGQAGAPLFLGVKYNIISEKDARQIAELKNTAPINLSRIDNITNLSPALKKLAKQRSTDAPDNVNLYYHLIAAIAHKAAEEVNNKTNFSKAAAEILNNGALVQVYTKAKEGKDTWTLQDFDTVYPGKSIKGVYLSAGKTYYSTGIKGNFTFKIDKGDGKPEKEANDDVVDTGPDPDLQDVAGDITNPRRAKRREPEVGVGRQKRK